MTFLIQKQGLFSFSREKELIKFISSLRNIKTMSSFSDDTISFVSGALAGISQVFVMQPFETIKVRQVNEQDGSTKYKGFIRSFKTILKQQGFLGFYKGTKSPLIGYSLTTSLQFGFNRYFRMTLAKLNGTETQLTLLAASILTGIPSALCVAPADHIRILMQKQQHGGGQNYKGELEASKDIYKRHGIKGIYLGFGVTLWRELLAMGIYFTCYQLAKRQMGHDRKGQWTQKLKVMAAGGLAGFCSWFIGYPLDFLKTRIQSQDIDNKKYKSIYDCFMKSYRRHGLKGFTRGLFTVCARSIPVNSISFLVDQEVAILMGRKKID